MRQLLGPDEASLLFEALSGESPVSVRHNPLKPVTTMAGAEPVPWCGGACYLPSRPSFVLNPLWHAGAFYVQEASSMFLARAVAQIEGPLNRVLDLCAAPGGKSTLWRSLLPDDALLVANEPVAARAAVLAENLQKWGHENVVTTQAYPNQFAPFEGYFDVVAADVPCSGEGMFRKDDEAIAQWSPEVVEMCAARSRQIVADVWPSLRQGGYLIYSTCTFNARENEDNVRHICQTLGAEFVPIGLDTSWGVVATEWGYHFYPHRLRGEGFFLALLRKTSVSGQRLPRTKPLAAQKISQSWLREPQRFVGLALQPNVVSAVLRDVAPDVAMLYERLHVVHAGVTMAEQKGAKLIPQTPLALSRAMAPDAFEQCEISLDEAQNYLRRQALVMPAAIARGYVVPTFEGMPLGFVNNLGSRANNLYPPQWRIRQA